MTKENYEIQTKLDKIIDRYRHLEEDIDAIAIEENDRLRIKRKNEAIKETNNAGIGGITYSPSYCLRVDHSGRQYYRFGYLKDTIENTYLRDELITTSNDPLANPHDRLQLQGWRANVDLKPILNLNVALSYISKYASRSEPLSFLSSRICCQE
ncbi:unnamed protein product [Rhizophagus irregularis]|uniref:Uncharacterized protein n=1 Tax=Rhizophagus irregularis TaxID=588596 RepID=A0A916E7L7_9GLOM|nr:unnamed protein product [Rhizophagus irregularis]